MALDAAKNFAKATVSTGYTSGATTVVLASGHGAKLPAAPFNAVWYDSTLYTDPSDDPNVEVIRVTVVSTDTLTVTRAQELTSAANHNTGGSTYKLVAGPTAKLITDVQAMSITGNASTATAATTGAITNDATTNASMFPVWVATASGNQALKVSPTIIWNPSTGALTATSFIGAADANTLSGTTLHSTVVNSSLTSLGTIALLTATTAAISAPGSGVVGPNLHLVNTTAGFPGDAEAITFWSGTYSRAQILSSVTDATSSTYSGDLYFNTKNVYSDGTFQARMFIRGRDGSIGVGTTTPAYALDVNGTINATAIRVGGVLNNGGLVQIAKITTSASQATVDFTSIPAIYTDLEVRIQARSNVSATFEQLFCKVNNDGTAANYTYSQWMDATGTAMATNNIAANAAGVGLVAISGSTSPANMATSERLEINNYAGTTFYKRLLSWGAETRATGAAQEYIEALEGVWKSTAAITRLTFSVPTSFVNGSVFTLYGIGTQ